MGMEPGFPKFDCLITGRREEYDSDIARYFISQDYLASEISEISALDVDWKSHYSDILYYLKSLENAVINGTKPSSHDFLVELSLVDALEDNSYDRLIRSRGNLASRVYRCTVMVRDLMFWFVRMSRKPDFASNFNPEVFYGLPYLRLALSYRSVELSRSAELE